MCSENKKETQRNITCKFHDLVELVAGNVVKCVNHTYMSEALYSNAWKFHGTKYLGTLIQQLIIA